MISEIAEKWFKTITDQVIFVVVKSYSSLNQIHIKPALSQLKRKLLSFHRQFYYKENKIGILYWLVPSFSWD